VALGDSKRQADKVPYQPNGKHGSSTDITTWVTYPVALRALHTNATYNGLGFMLMGAEVAAFDLDNCRNPKTGEVHPWAQKLVEKCNSYTEITPSGYRASYYRARL
jgi:putative DNA primase/helicase